MEMEVSEIVERLRMLESQMEYVRRVIAVVAPTTGPPIVRQPLKEVSPS